MSTNMDFLVYHAIVENPMLLRAEAVRFSLALGWIKTVHVSVEEPKQSPVTSHRRGQK
jgi:hypothetical protein